MLQYDGIVIGAGHNGLILQGYLAKAGLRVAAFERALEIGGGLDTHEYPPYLGFYHNIHSVFHRSLANLPWYADLELEKYGLEYAPPPEVSIAMLLSDGRSLLWYADLQRTCRSLAKFSIKDANTFSELYHAWQGLVRKIVFPENYSPPVPQDKKRAILKKSRVGREYLTVATKSPLEIVREEFENEHVQAFILGIVLVRGYQVYDRGLGQVVPTLFITGSDARLCKGTSHSLAHHLHTMVVKNGGHVFEQQEVRRILVEGGTAKGVELHDGSMVYATGFIASSLDPHHTFLELVGEECLDASFVERLRRFRYSRVGPLFAINLALNEPPRYIAAEAEPDAGRGLLNIIGLDTIEDIDRLFQAHEKGWIPDKLFFHGTTPTLFDPTQAPPGKHTAFIWPLAPYSLRGGGPARWDEVKNELMERYLGRWRELAPNLDERNILHKFCHSPLDTERHLPNMVQGDPLVGELSADQMLDRRPLPELSRYRTPIKNLYLCGSCCHPGGNITGGPGHNAAGVIADAMGIQKWWNPPDVERLWEELD